jgi:hypothetical protein
MADINYCGNGYTMAGYPEPTSTGAFHFCENWQQGAGSPPTTYYTVAAGMAGIEACKKICDDDSNCTHYTKGGVFCGSNYASSCNTTWETTCGIVRDCGFMQLKNPSGQWGALHCAVGPQQAVQRVDVRSEEWYSHYRHSVFAMIGSAYNKGFKEFNLLQVKPPIIASRTNEEFPALQQDILDAYLQKNNPFYDGAQEIIRFQSIKFIQEDPDKLRSLFENNSRNSSCVIVVSCPRNVIDDTTEAIRQHNAIAVKMNWNPVNTGWATGRDMYQN